MGKKKTYEEVKYIIEVESNSGCNNDCKKLDKHNKIYNIDRVNEIILLYNQHKSMKEISKIVKMKRETISKILKENNITIKNVTEYFTSEQLATNIKYNFNKDFFETIDTELKAYWLGFLFADGNVFLPKSKYEEGKTKGGRLEVGLKAEDDYHLGNLINDINGNQPITYRDVKLNNKLYPSCRIQIHSIKMANDLIAHGCTPNKSLTLEFPNHLPKEFLPHFIRGYIDGDGCVFFKVYSYEGVFKVSILGTFNFLIDIKNILLENDIKSSDVKQDKSKVFNINITGQDNLVKLYNYLYKDATRFLGRKIDKYRQAMLYFDKDFEISPVAKLFYLLDDELEELKFEKWYKKTDLYKQVQEFRQTDLYKQIQQQR